MPNFDRLPADARRSLRVYNLFCPFVFLALLPGFLRRMFRRGRFREKFGQRLALFTDEDRSRFARQESIWIHSISVGETLVALKLARKLRKLDRSIQIALSVTTSTAFALALEAEEDWLRILYNPLDFPSLVRETLETIRPIHLVLVEGEIWPNLVAECRRRGIPVSLVNARLSRRSEARFLRFRAWTGAVFRLLDFIYVPEPEEVARWVSLGVDPDRVRCTGSIKFDEAHSPAATRLELFRGFLSQLSISPESPILLGGSTWPSEERLLAELLIALRREWPELFLILVPRHVERTPQILRELTTLGLRPVCRSAFPLITPCNADVLIVDSTGELRDWYEVATVVFVGKSLAGGGGQNPAEPAALGKPIIFGPSMENFAALIDLLLAHRAAVQVPDAPALETEVRRLLRDADQRTQLGLRAREALAVHRGATARTAEILLAARARGPRS
jgi:3-deoxy-D-manno-octulosonic-acid transferase